jgi:hypothetical protein
LPTIPNRICFALSGLAAALETQAYRLSCLGLSICNETIYTHRFSRAGFRMTALQWRHEYGFEDDVD